LGVPEPSRVPKKRGKREIPRQKKKENTASDRVTGCYEKERKGKKAANEIHRKRVANKRRKP